MRRHLLPAGAGADRPLAGFSCQGGSSRPCTPLPAGLQPAFQQQHVAALASPGTHAQRCRPVAAAPVRKQQPQPHRPQPDEDSDAGDDSWYTSSSSSSSRHEPSSSSSTSSTSKRLSSSSSSRSRFRRAAATTTGTGTPPAGKRSAKLAVGGARARTAQPSQAAQHASSEPLQLPAAEQQQEQHEQQHVQEAVQQQLSSLAVQSSSSSAGQPPPPLSSQLPAPQVAQLRAYLSHLLEVNKVMNLTAIRDPEEAWERHIEDSLALLPVIEQYACSSSSSVSSSSSGPLSVIDVGTGAGLPGMVLAVVRPDWQVTLLDSLRKRCDFLEGTATMLGLSNVRVVWSRAEDGGRQRDLREGYDVAVARAVAELRVLAELCLPFVRPGGLWVAAKGADPEAEVAAAAKALPKLRGQLAAVPRVQSWAPEGQRTAVVVVKVGSTPQQYPRAPGTPSKKPL